MSLLKSLISIFQEPKANQNIPDQNSLPSGIALQRAVAKAYYQEAYIKIPKQLFDDPNNELLNTLRSSSVQERTSGRWMPGVLSSGKNVYFNKFPIYPEVFDAQAGIAAVIIDPQDATNVECFVLNVSPSMGNSVRRVYYKDGSPCSSPDGPGCDNTIDAFFDLLDCGKSGMEREREEVQLRIAKAMLEFDKKNNR